MTRARTGHGDIAILGVGLILPGFPTATAWKAGVRDEAMGPPAGNSIEPRTRRRTSGLTRALADAYTEALTGGALDKVTVASVFGSAIGEAATMIGLLDQMWREGGPLSPMRFATSVHNAASGVVSISTGNRGFTTSIGADFDTPAMALVEAIGLVRSTQSPVIVACADEEAPHNLVLDGKGWGMVAVAVAIGPAGSGEVKTMTMDEPALLEVDAASVAPADLDPMSAQNPQAGLVDLVNAVLGGSSGRLRLDRGRGRGYSVNLWAAPP